MALIWRFVVPHLEMVSDLAWLLDGNPRVIDTCKLDDPLLVLANGVPIPGRIKVATSLSRAAAHRVVKDALPSWEHELSYDWTVHSSVEVWEVKRI